MKKRNYIFFILIILSFFLYLFFSSHLLDEKEILTVHFIDIGQGDAILIQTPQGKNMLIDGGDRWNWVGEKLVSYLTKQGVNTIDIIVSTHPHADHIGGLASVINNFKVNAIYDSGRIHTSQTYENYLLLIYEKEIPFFTPRRGDVIKLGSLLFNVLHPGVDVERYSLNNASIVLHLEYGKVSFLFTGDAERQAEQEILTSSFNIESTILKVGHHGSRRSSQEAFLEQVKAEIAVIQLGKDNRYGFPHIEVIEALKTRDIKIYRNDLHGDIVVYTDGKDYWLETSKKSKK